MQIVGRLEVTVEPDGSSLRADSIVSRAVEMQSDGAGVLELALDSRTWGDDGGGLAEIIAAVQTLRLLVAIRTPHFEVLRRAIVAGVDIVDCMDENLMARVRLLAAAHGTALVVTACVDGKNDREENPVDRLIAAIDNLARTCSKDGLPVGQIIVAIGTDRAIPETEAMLSLRSISRIVAAGYRVMVNIDCGESAVVGQVPGDARTIGVSVGIATWAVLQGAQMVRARDVRTAWRAVTMTNAVLDPAWQPS